MREHGAENAFETTEVVYQVTRISKKGNIEKERVRVASECVP